MNQQNYFSDLYPTKILDLSALFFPYVHYKIINLRWKQWQDTSG